MNTKTNVTPSSRLVAMKVLVKIEEAGAFSNIQLNTALQEAGLSRADAGLTTEIVYGTLSRKLTIDYILDQCIAKGVKKLQTWVHQLLRLSVYQLYWLDRIPPHAIVNEAVKIAKKKGHQGISGMVNGVLRTILREQDKFSPRHLVGKNELETLSIRYSFPLWMVEHFVNEYDVATVERILESSNTSPNSSIRVNTMKYEPKDIIATFAQHEIIAVPSLLSSDGLVVENGGHLAGHSLFTSGAYSMQDESSMLVAEIVNPKSNMHVLDACAAPGGKTMHMAERMQGKGTIYANDLYEHKAALIKEHAVRLGLHNIEVSASDAAKLDEKFAAESFDAVLLDAPCSGLGVIKRKPEIKWTKLPSDISDIADIQAELLQTVSKLVKSGGTLVYSTCTIAQRENQQQVEAFLKANPQFKLDKNWDANLLQRLEKLGVINESFAGYIQVLPFHANSDGFFIARLVKA